MNLGYNEILDYLMSSHREEFKTAMMFDSGYMVEKIFNGTTPYERVMMVLDYIINSDEEYHSGMREFVRHYASDVLGASVCGAPLVEYAKRMGKPKAIEMFDGVPVTEVSEGWDDMTVIKIFKLKLNDEPTDSVDMLRRGVDFIRREAAEDWGPQI